MIAEGTKRKISQWIEDAPLVNIASDPQRLPLPYDHLEPVEGWAMHARSLGYVYRPTTTDDVHAVFDLARSRNLTVCLRGAGRSYGDAALAREQIVLDLTRMNRILYWNPESGVLVVEPGVTIQQMWEYTIGDGWWSHVVPGTMYPTLGGALAANIHGKNNVMVGSLGEHVQHFDLMLPDGRIERCTPTENADLFKAAIGSFGLLGVFIRITLQLRKIHSGLVRVTPFVAKNLSDMFRIFEEPGFHGNYEVGWIDCFAKGDQLGRGLVHRANHLEKGEDPRPTQTLRIENQRPGDEILGFVPKSILWRFMKPLLNNVGMRLLNSAQYNMGHLKAGKSILQSYVAYSFMLDYVPNWKKAYAPHGLIQYQVQIPKENAESVFARQLALCQKHGLIPYLAVFKKHRKAPFLLSYLVNGYSLALDFKVTPHNKARLYALAAEMDAITLAAGGRHYFAKDITLRPELVTDSLGEEQIRQFLSLKESLDPEGILQTDLYRRLFPSLVTP